MDQEHFINSYQTLKFQGDSKNVFNNAIIKRKCLAVSFFGSIEAGEENTTTIALLEEDLKEYSKVVDDQGSENVNNYADYVLASLPQNQNDNQKHWKTSLTESMLSELLKPLSCSRNGELSCKNSKITENDVNLLKQAQSKFNSDLEENQFVNMKISHRENSRSFEAEPTFTDNSRNFSLKPNYGNSRSFEYRPNILKRDSGSKSNNFKSSNNDVTPEVNNEPKQNSGFFKTARDELHVQNLKKFGKNAPSTSSEKNYNYNYGGVKRSLGARVGAGAYSKFQPPVKNKEEPPPPNQETENEVVDERLKNIDPKMIELIRNEIMDCGSTITWDDIAGLEDAKNTIMEIVVWPMLRPDIFTGLRRPPKGILLFGPPGTGKTLIGKCVASQSNSTFFSISASSLTSKWIGEGEKMVRALFAVAKVHQPSVVFIDEIDSLLCQRSDTEHESSRRLKTEFLVQLDGAGTGDEDRILIIGATNRPQELDEAARRRLVRRLYIPLPDETARKQMIRNLISKERHCLTESEIEEIGVLTKGYSGADVKNLCQEASLGPIRSIPPSEIRNIDPNKVRPLNSTDFKSALARIKSSVSDNDLDTYIAWDRQYGCGSGV